ncbi:MAG: DUF1153 domain-containing protein [Geminicoccaceae bacterium]
MTESYPMERVARGGSLAVGPDGHPLSGDDLPPPDTHRWVARRKAEVVSAVRAGLLSLEEACTRYQLSAEEFRSWEAAIDRHGLGGLRVTRIQEFR